MIDERKLIEELKQSGMIADNEYGNVMVAIIESQPQIDRWIPCSERILEKPKENPVFENKPLELYLVSIECEEYPLRAFWNGEFFTDGWSKVNAVAWMPLPKQFHENRQEKCKLSRVLPILFNTEMVQVIVDGQKTVTRRVVKKSQCRFFTKKQPSDLQKKGFVLSI